MVQKRFLGVVMKKTSCMPAYQKLRKLQILNSAKPHVLKRSAAGGR